MSMRKIFKVEGFQVIRLVLMLMLMMLAGARPFATTIPVASPYAPANAATAIAAAATGDTVQFPSGASVTWSSTVTVGKAITIDLNGTTLTAGATLADGFFYVTGFTSTSLMRITGGVFNCVSLASGRHALKILDSIDLTQLRVDHNTFHHGDIQVEVGGSLGVFDHNTFYNGTSAVYFTAGSRAQADASWVSMAAGTSSALFFEDNQFIYNTSWLGSNENNSCFDTYNGGKIVIRYNTFTATSVPGTWTGPLGVILTHGNAANGGTGGYWESSASNRRGQSVVEIYNNTVNATRADFLCSLRGSANLVHDNTLDTTFVNPYLAMYEEEQWNSNFSPLRTAWPAEDQVHNSFLWNNTLRLNGVANASYVEVINSSDTFIQQDRDYFLHAPAATGGSESFTSANGAAGTDPTDGSPYANSGTMTFSAAGANAYYPYTAYTYPHPFTAGGGGGGSSGTLTRTSGGVRAVGGVRMQ